MTNPRVEAALDAFAGRRPTDLPGRYSQRSRDAMAAAVAAADRAAWQPIETAPRDGTLIDVWCAREMTDEQLGLREAYGVKSNSTIRLTDVSWSDRGWMRVTDTGMFDWVEEGPCDETGLPPWTPTHWRPLPPAPGDAG